MSAARGYSRRAFLGGGGALVVTFGLLQVAGAETDATAASSPQAPGTMVTTEVAEQEPSATQTAAPAAASAASTANQVDSWLAIGQDNSVTIFSGRVELGTGTRTALAQIAADELYVPFESITMVQGDTARAPDEGYTAGSKTIQVGGVSVRNAAATARQTLLNLAAARFGVDQTSLSIGNASVTVTSDPSRSVTFGELIGGQRLDQTVAAQPQLKDPSQYTLVGQPVPRLDLPAKVFGQPATYQTCACPTCCTVARCTRSPSAQPSPTSTKARLPSHPT